MELKKIIKNTIRQYLNENSMDDIMRDVFSKKFEILYDTNGDLKRALGVNSVPFTFLLDGNCNIVWKHNNYNQGDEEELYNQIKKLTNENSKINRK